MLLMGFCIYFNHFIKLYGIHSAIVGSGFTDSLAGATLSIVKNLSSGR